MNPSRVTPWRVESVVGCKRRGFHPSWLASVVGPVPTALVGGFIGLAVSVWGWFTFKQIRELDKVEDIEASRGS